MIAFVVSECFFPTGAEISCMLLTGVSLILLFAGLSFSDSTAIRMALEKAALDVGQRGNLQKFDAVIIELILTDGHVFHTSTYVSGEYAYFFGCLLFELM